MTKMDEVLAHLARIELLLEQICKEKGVTDVPHMSTDQTAGYLHLSRSRVYALVYAGKLKPLQQRKSSRMLFDKEELNRYLAEHGKTAERKNHQQTNFDNN